MKIIKFFFVLTFFAAFGLQALAASGSPALEDVLAGKGSPVDFGFILVGFFALSLATLSLAKGYKVFSRPKIIKDDSLAGANEELNKENGELKHHINKLEELIKDKITQEDILLKNITSLRREGERLVAEKQRLASEKDSLTLKLNQSSFLEPKIEAAEKAAVEVKMAEAPGLSTKIKAKKPSAGKKQSHSTRKKNGGKRK